MGGGGAFQRERAYLRGGLIEDLRSCIFVLHLCWNIILSNLQL